MAKSPEFEFVATHQSNGTVLAGESNSRIVYSPASLDRAAVAFCEWLDLPLEEMIIRLREHLKEEIPRIQPGPNSFTDAQMRFREDLSTEIERVRNMLIKKNEAYGDSALDPVRVFSKSDPIEQIFVRIDDKLSRLKRGDAAGEDVELDLIGYLFLLRIARMREARAKNIGTHFHTSDDV